MSPNHLSHNSGNFMQMNKTGAKASGQSTTDVPVDRLYEIARHLAQMELTGNELIDNCVTLLDSDSQYHNPYNTGQRSLLTVPPSAPQPPKPLSMANNNSDRNYCEVVSVPTSQHVAQIVGKQGSKIKLLRAKSRTYIQTPVSGEEPVFIITGRREDVLKVKYEILSASDHFTAISEERQRKLKQNCDIPGGITLNLITPVFLIGLVVGRSGNTIRKLQEQTHTYIETPKMLENSRFAAFRISGQSPNVESVIAQITEHVKSKNPDRLFGTFTLSTGDIKLDLID